MAEKREGEEERSEKEEEEKPNMAPVIFGAQIVGWFTRTPYTIHNTPLIAMLT